MVTITNIDYNKNIKKILGIEDRGLKVLKKYAGFLKNKLKKSGISYQRELRKEWER